MFPKELGLCLFGTVLGGAEINSYAATLFPFASTVQIDQMAIASTTAATARSTTPQAILDSLALNSYVWFLELGSSFTNTSGTSLAIVGNAIASVKCIKSGALIVSPSVTNYATLTASDGLDFITDDYYELPDLAWSSGELNLVAKMDSGITSAVGSGLYEIGGAGISGSNGTILIRADGTSVDGFAKNPWISASRGSRNYTTGYWLWNSQVPTSGNHITQWNAASFMDASSTIDFTPDSTKNAIGRTRSGNQYFYWHGNIKALLLENAVFSATDRANIEQFLKAYFGLLGY